MGAIDKKCLDSNRSFIKADDFGKPFIKINDNLYFTAKDIRQVQLAKGAILSGRFESPTTAGISSALARIAECEVFPPNCVTIPRTFQSK